LQHVDSIPDTDCERAPWLIPPALIQESERKSVAKVKPLHGICTYWQTLKPR